MNSNLQEGGVRFFILVSYLVITVFMIAVILFQRSEASAGLGGGTMGGMMTARGTANLLTRLTAVLATLFMGANLLLAYLEKQESARNRVQEVPVSAPEKDSEFPQSSQSKLALPQSSKDGTPDS